MSTWIESRSVISCRLSAVEWRSSGMKMTPSITPSLTMYGSRITRWACLCQTRIINHIPMQTHAQLHTYRNTHFQAWSNGAVFGYADTQRAGFVIIWGDDIIQSWPHSVVKTYTDPSIILTSTYEQSALCWSCIWDLLHCKTLSLLINIQWLVC